MRLGIQRRVAHSYRKGDQVIDLLVLSGSNRFTSEEHGGRGFDAAPGLSLAIAGAPITHHLDAVLSDGTSLQVSGRTPSVEHAVVLKALASAGRSQLKDLIDLYNLLLIAEQYPRESIGGWRLDEANVKGSRLDAVRQLSSLRTMPGLRAALEGSAVPAPALVQLILSLAPRSE